MRSTFLLFTFLLAITVSGYSQDANLQTNQSKFWSFRLGAGTANYFGDLVNPGDFGQPGLSIVAGAEYRWTPHWSLRANLTFLRLTGDDKFADDDRQERNLSFFSNNLELTGAVLYHLIKIPETGYANRKYVNVYAFLGGGLVYINPKATRSNGQTVALQPLETEGVAYSKVQFVMPYGLGLKVKIDPRFNINLEGGYRTVFSDYLDDISSRSYPNPATLKSDLAREMSDRRREIDADYPLNLGKRGNSDKRDGYFIINISLQYTLGNSSGKGKMKM